jgi:hypothetical protein
MAAGAAIGIMAARFQLAGFAPLGLLPLAAGITLGYLVSKLATATGEIGARRLVARAAFFAFVAVLVEHTWLYHDFRRQWQDARTANPQVALFRPAEPWTPAEYLRHEVASGSVKLWCVDAALIVAGALSVVFVRRGATEKQIVVADDASSPRLPTPHT